jgi:DnaK suppressor protein
MVKTAEYQGLQEWLERRLAEVETLLTGAAAELQDGFARERRRIRAALDRIREERYGVCCACEDELSVGYLQADPAAPFCMPCEMEIKQSKRNR